MKLRMPPRAEKTRARASLGETPELLKEAFVCVSIPAAAFVLAYMTLQTAIRLFQG